MASTIKSISESLVPLLNYGATFIALASLAVQCYVAKLLFDFMKGKVIVSEEMLKSKK